MLTDKENKRLELMFPGWHYPVPPVCTAYWDFTSWVTWIQQTGINPKNDFQTKEKPNEPRTNN